MSTAGSAGQAAGRDLAYLSVEALGERLRRRELSPVEITRVYLERIAAFDPALHAFITVTGEQVLEDAALAEREIAAGRYRGPLHGVPLAIKDLFYTAGVRTTAGSRILADFVPTEDATVVARLKTAGALSVGKTNMEEFAYGATSLNPHYGACRNPWDPERIAGGSSGGSAAAVAAGLCAAALGSDSGGSIRQPAALCGLVGLKPSYGRVSKFGVVPLSWSQDHVGPMARTVRDAAVIAAGARGPRPARSHEQRRADRGLSRGHRGRRDGTARRAAARLLLRAGGCGHRGGRPCGGPGARRARRPSGRGALPASRGAFAAGAAILFAEATAFHERWLRTRPEDDDPAVRARLEVGATLLATDYLKAQRARRLLVEQTVRLFDEIDVLLTPTAAVPAPRRDEQLIRWPDNTEEDVRGATLRFTRVFNLLGLPGRLGPLRHDQRGTANRSANRGAAVRRGHRAPGGTRVRARAALGGPAPAVVLA